MNDLIDRQEAIDALDEIESEVADGYGYQYEKWRKYFCGLPSAQPEKRTEERTETHACDLIDRQAAIDAVNTWFELYVVNRTTANAVSIQDMLRALPSAQPDSKETSSTHKALDTISRQDAIDALFELYEYQRDIDPTEAADLVRQGIFLAEKKIEQLPSAQPEVIRCKDCRWRKDQSGSTAWLPCRAIVTPSDFYCGRAERRTDE